MTASITVVLDDLLSVSGAGSATSIEVTLTQEGPPGPGVPNGGTTGQLLSKASDDDQDTEWVDATAAAGYLTSSAAALAYQPLAAVLTGTTASFTTADETKLDHISVTQAVDLDSMESQSANGQTAFGWGNHASGGYLTGITSQSIKNLSDVYDSMTPTDGQLLTYDSTNGWQAENAPTSFDPASPGTIGGTAPGVVNATKVVIAAGTHTVSTDRVQTDNVTWNGSGQTMVAKRTSVTPTAANVGASSFQQYELGGTVRVDILAGGGITVSDAGYSLYSFRTDSNNPFRADSAGVAITSAALNLKSTFVQKWTSTGNWYDTADTGTARSAAGVVEANNGTLGTLRDFKGRNLIATNLIKNAHFTTATRPAFSNGDQFFDDDLDKLVVGGVAAWEVVTSV